MTEEHVLVKLASMIINHAANNPSEEITRDETWNRAILGSAYIIEQTKNDPNIAFSVRDDHMLAMIVVFNGVFMRSVSPEFFDAVYANWKGRFE